MNSRRIVQAAAVLLLAAAVVVMALVARTWWRDRNSYESDYTRIVNSRDVADTCQRAISALQDADAQAQGYVLTGETAYSEAYAEDLRVWQDEFGTLELEGAGKGTAQQVRDLSKSGTRVLDELAALVSLRDKGSSAAALDRLHKGSAFVYLEQARAVAGKLQEDSELDASGIDRKLVMTAPIRNRRLAEGAAALFGIALAEALLVFLSTRRGRGSTSESREKRAVATGD